MMKSSSLRSHPATSIRHHDRGLTLIFGSDGQVSLFGLGDGIASQTHYTLPASNTGAPTPGTYSLPSGSNPVSSIPILEVTSTSLGSSSSHAPTSLYTSGSSSSAASSYGSSSITTDTDTSLPSIPTAGLPTPNPTPVSNPKDHGVGAPFYLAIVLASISFIGCVAAFIAWWIRSRGRAHDLELEDPWNHRDTISDTGSPLIGNATGLTHSEPQTRPYHLPASIVRRNSSNLLAVPHAISTLEYDASKNGALHRMNDTRSQMRGPRPNSYSRPEAKHLQSGLSVQESTRTLGKLRVANRVPGDVTSGDEGGINIPRPRNNNELSPIANAGRPDDGLVGGHSMRNPYSEVGSQYHQEGDAPLEPPGPATSSWGRRTDTVAALRRTRRRTPGTTVQTYKNPKYGGYLYPTPSEEASGAIPREDERTQTSPPLDPLGWTSTLKSSFWQAVDAMTGSRPSDPELGGMNPGSGSRFTPAPQRATTRRSPIPSIRLSTLPDARATGPKETDVNHEPTQLDNCVAPQYSPENLTHPNFVRTSSLTNESGMPHISEIAVGRMDSRPPIVSRLNHDLGAGTHQRHPDSLRVDTGSLYSTDSAAARANLRKYGYGDPIPSSWSALGATRESQLDLGRFYLPLPGPSPDPFSVTPSQLTLDSGFLSSSVGTRTRMPMQSENDLIGSDASTLRSLKNVNAASQEETTTGSMYSISRDSTAESGRNTINYGFYSQSATSSMLSRKKGVSTRRKRPRLPPRAPSTASSVQSIESGLSIREVAIRRALLERRKKVKAAESLKGREDGLMHDRDVSNMTGT